MKKYLNLNAGIQLISNYLDTCIQVQIFSARKFYELLLYKRNYPSFFIKSIQLKFFK